MSLFANALATLSPISGYEVLVEACFWQIARYGGLECPGAIVGRGIAAINGSVAPDRSLFTIKSPLADRFPWRLKFYYHPRGAR